MLNEILIRLREPSSYAGFATLALVFGVSNAEYQVITNAIAAVAGVLAFYMTERA